MDFGCKNCKSLNINPLKSLEKDALCEISNLKHSHFIKKGSILFEEGDTLSGVFCIKEGVCKLTKLSSNGKSQIVRFAKGGDMLGMQNIISQEPAYLTATALKNVRVCFIPKEQILTSITENIQFSSHLIKESYSELCKAENIIVDMAQKTAKQRLADSLLYLKDTFDVDNEGFIDIKLSREEIGNLIGTATESIIRMLSEFAKNGLIQTQGKRIKISDYQKLKLTSEGNFFNQTAK